MIRPNPESPAPDPSLSRDTQRSPATGREGKRAPQDLLLQIYSSLGIVYDELNGVYRVRP